MSQQFIAMFETTCEACGEDIVIGADAIYDADHEVIHLECFDELGGIQ